MTGDNIRLKVPKFRPPEPFDFFKPAEWPQWEERFVWYWTATDLGKDDGEVQLSFLMYAMGPEAEHVFGSFKFATREDGEKDFERILRKFKEHFIPKGNVIHERARFHQRSLWSGGGGPVHVESLWGVYMKWQNTVTLKPQETNRFMIESWLAFWTKICSKNFSWNQCLHLTKPLKWLISRSKSTLKSLTGPRAR